MNLTTLPATVPSEERPWGAFFVLADLPNTKVKIIRVKPGERLSYQSHEQRAEHWIVTSGVAEVTINGDTQKYTYGQHIFIPRGAKHRMACPAGDVPLEIVEIQVGDGFAESDIVRYEDDYKRT